MRRTLLTLTLACFAGLLTTPSANGQSPRAEYQQTTASRTRNPFAAAAGPTVSPYLNLGTNSDGVSNYQTLVRPLIEERQALRQQWAELEKINRELRGPTAPSIKPRTAVRFMDYSHYFGSTR